jgi:hypothetical protein
MYLQVDALQHYDDYSTASTCICFSSGVPAIFPYLTSQSFFSGFHRPPAALACCRAGMSAALIRRGTIMSSEYRCAGGVQGVRSTISSIVFNRCRDFASYRKRTHRRSLPYFSTRLFVPRCPGLRISLVFTRSLRTPVIILRGKIRSSGHAREDGWDDGQTAR